MSFQLASGVKVSDLTGIEQAFQVRKTEKYTVITLNISRENLESIILDLLPLVATPGFFVLEFPSHRDTEKLLRKDEDDPFHKDVYYLDGQGIDGFKQLWFSARELLLDDGIVTFGFGSHPNCTEGQTDEIFVGKYKIFKIYSNNPDKFLQALNKLDIPQVEKLKTVWDNFSKENPGRAERIDINGNDIYDLAESLKEQGLYFKEHRIS